MANRIIESYYVDSIDSDKTVESAIVAMLKTLDPHSTYTDAEETRELTTPLEGNFSGIGIQFSMLEDTVFVIQTIPGGPCEKVGIVPGDRIIQAGDSLLAGRKLPNSRILNILRGPKGSIVPLTVVRRGESEPMIFTVERDDIPIHSVDASFMADPTTGYVRITRFAENTAEELKEALAGLRSQGMKNLIIDLEDNGGGYLGAATEIASEFLPKDAPIVYTEAPKLGTNKFDNMRKGSFLDGRLVIMVNQYSASASEILSGAIQDNDRGLIVGRRTFGKGLVQRPFNFPDGSMIRLTVSRYFTPSGRCIQRPYDRENIDDYNLDILHRFEHGEFTSADSVQLDKSQLHYTLLRRRPVYGGGGIMPDLFVPLDTTAVTPYYRQLLAKGIINRLAITYVDDNRDSLHTEFPSEQAFIDGFSVSPDLIARVADLATTSGIELNQDELDSSTPMLRTILKGLIGRDLFQTSTYYKIVYPVLNDEYIAALQLINDKKTYQNLLKNGQKTK
ncbi:MAG: S41 family peptidase [Muribaculaceae bacterium]|nr:S41 family peptidase [Muribaculaceae bacterium]